MNALISIIILNYNGRQYLKDCFKSLKKQIYQPIELIMIDNGSSDGSVEYVRENFSDIRIIQNNKNYGFAEGNNIGVKSAKGEYVVLLNNDVTVPNNWLTELYETVKCGAVIGDSMIQNQGMPDGFYEKNGTLNILGHNIPCVFSDLAKTFYASGCSMIFNKDLVGIPFDPDYFAYQEDVYLGWKVRLQGGEIKHCPESIVNHLSSKTAKKIGSSKITFYQERNRLLNLFIFYQLKTIIKIFPLLMVELILRSIIVTLSRRKSIVGFIGAVGWLVFNCKKVLEKRSKIQKSRVVDDNGILQWMTSRLVWGDKILSRIINSISMCYCGIVGLSTYEIGSRKSEIGSRKS